MSLSLARRCDRKKEVDDKVGKSLSKPFVRQPNTVRISDSSEFGLLHSSGDQSAQRSASHHVEFDFANVTIQPRLKFVTTQNSYEEEG